MVGEKKAREKLRKEFEANPPLLFGRKMLIESQGTYLGEEIGGSVKERVTLTLNKRLPFVKKSIFEIKHIIMTAEARL